MILARHKPTQVAESSAKSRPRERGFSLTELLVASAIALLLMASVASLFAVFSRALSQGQTTVELASKMRTTAWRLRRDLAGVTVRMAPPVRPEANAGYFELIEGPLRDLRDPPNSAPNSAAIDADTDDILLFTTKAAGTPFVGKYGANDTVESDTAEVAWFCRLASAVATPADLPAGMQVFNLYRRQGLVVGYVGKEPFFTPGNRLAMPSGGLPAARVDYDISLRQENVGQSTPTLVLVPNTLADLTDRRNRFGHSPTGFPFVFELKQHETDQRNPKPYYAPPNLTFDDSTRAWEDVVLTNVIGFDVRVYDPCVRAQPFTPTNLVPGDLGYAEATLGTGAYGAYVDLGARQGVQQLRNADGTVQPLSPTTLGAPLNPNAKQLTTPAAGINCFCTWSTSYELNGLDDDGDNAIDEGTNGADDNGNGLVDEASELETSPPYPVPLRGIEVRLRCYDPVSKQVRQITIRQAFR